MPASGSYAYHDLRPAAASFLDDVVAGLSASPKTLPPKYFYDARGSRLFEAICALPEYYLTRTELALTEARADEIGERIGRGATLIEYGIGSGRKTALVIAAARPRVFAAIDISAEQLRAAVAELAAAFPDVHMAALCADYTQTAHGAVLETLGPGRRVLYFPGSTIGNFTVAEALAFLTNAREVAGTGGAMLIGVDTKKDAGMLNAAYDDAQGVTAEFNLNVLRRVNAELGGDFDLESFVHRAFYDSAHGRIEMHLESTRAQLVTVAGRRFAFAAGETIHTESSYKYAVDEFQALAREAGFTPAHCWLDTARLFSIHYLAVAA
jgi:dimethylhistidine N-methyltransferase